MSSFAFPFKGSLVLVVISLLVYDACSCPKGYPPWSCSIAKRTTRVHLLSKLIDLSQPQTDNLPHQRHNLNLSGRRKGMEAKREIEVSENSQFNGEFLCAVLPTSKSCTQGRDGIQDSR
ncbi:uncharacterized protein LOC142335978 [Convolutriloba macropyga]|uniref:uncharacterized protein LOC142335978 n=1 Tax=Convolutriloba macropyga TaxID=536237 RepID=UPI003F52844C